MGRRGVKEYRAPEALILIALDREGKPLVCPSCTSTDIARVPRREDEEAAGRVTMTCKACGRHASYLERGSGPSMTPEEPMR